MSLTAAWESMTYSSQPTAGSPPDFPPPYQAPSGMVYPPPWPTRHLPMRGVSVDSELEQRPDDVEGGWGEAKSGGCGMACAAIYDSEGSRPYLYDRAGIHKLCEHLES